MLYIYSFITVAVGVILIFTLKNPETVEKEAISIKDVAKVMKIKQVWWIALLILSAYTLYSGLSYLNPYLSTAFGISVALSSSLGIIRNYGIKIIAPMLGGFMSNKLKSSTLSMSILFVLSLIFLAMYLIIPQKASFIAVAVIIFVATTFLLTAIRAIYYVPIDESNIPMRLTGTAVGIICVIGYIPDAYFFSLIGGWIDKYGVLGYQYMFIYLIVFGLLGVLASTMLYKMNKKSKLDLIDQEK